MDSKQGFSSASYDEAVPPSYNETISSNYTSKSSTSQYYSQQIKSHLQSFTAQISSLKKQKSLLSHAQDEKILSLLTTEIQLYLSEFAKTGMQKGTLILVPAKGIEDESAMPTDYDFKNPEEYDRVVRVRESKEEGSYDGEGEMWFWRDEDMAERLAGYLKPAPDPRTTELPPRKGEVKAAEQQVTGSSSRGFWGRRKSSIKSSETPPLEGDRKDLKAYPEIPIACPIERVEEKVLMDIKAEEVVFRTENDFGLYGTERGWGIVLKLNVVL